MRNAPPTDPNAVSLQLAIDRAPASHRSVFGSLLAAEHDSFPDDVGAWSERVLDLARGPLRASVGADLLPIRPARLGCGAFGCVYPTATPGIVCKITADPAEARIAALCVGGAVEPGVVRYDAVLRLPSPDRPAFALWREEAEDVGKLWDEGTGDAVFDLWTDRLSAFQTYAEGFSEVCYASDAPSSAVARAFAELPESAHRRPLLPTRLETLSPRAGASPYGCPRSRYHAIQRMMSNADELLGSLDPIWRRGDAEVRARHALACCRRLASLLAEDDFGDLVGAAMGAWIDRGMLMCDIDFKNLGMVRRSGRRALVITDPGLGVLLDPSLLLTRIPSIDGANR